MIVKKRKSKSLRFLYPNEEPVYQGMLQRCYNKKSTGFHNYGGRGIRVCNRWRKSFLNFYKDMGQRPINTTLDRANNDKNYKPSNCRWASYKDQANNKRNNHIITYNSKTLTIEKWAESLNIKSNLIVYRILRNWPIGQALGLEERIRPLHSRLFKIKNKITKMYKKGIPICTIAKKINYDQANLHRFLVNEKIHISKKRTWPKEKKR